MVGEFVLKDGTCMRDESANHVFLEMHSEVVIGPGFVSILKCRHAEDEFVDVFEVGFATALIFKSV